MTLHLPNLAILEKRLLVRAPNVHIHGTCASISGSRVPYNHACLSPVTITIQPKSVRISSCPFCISGKPFLYYCHTIFQDIIYNVTVPHAIRS